MSSEERVDVLMVLVPLRVVSLPFHALCDAAAVHGGIVRHIEGGKRRLV